MVETRRSKAFEGNYHDYMAEMLLNRELYWASMPHTTRKGDMPFLSFKEDVEARLLYDLWRDCSDLGH